MCFPADHPASLGLRYGSHDMIPKADFILVIDCDVPWIPTQCKPSKSATIVHIDVDPLKQQMPVFYIHAQARFKAESETAFTQLIANNAFTSGSCRTICCSSRDTILYRGRDSRASDSGSTPAYASQSMDQLRRRRSRLVRWGRSRDQTCARLPGVAQPKYQRPHQ